MESDGLTLEWYGMTFPNCHLTVDYFLADSSLALDVVTKNGEAVARITTCLNRMIAVEDEGYVDTNNCPWAEEFIKKYKLGSPTGKYKSSGFCIYPLYKFDMDEIQKYVKGEGE